MLYDAAYWIKHLNLSVHVEGGAFREIYRSPLVVNKESLPTTFNSPKNSSTSIYFLLKEDQFSAFHRIKSDEIWHHYTGGTLEIFEIDTNGEMIRHLLGKEAENGESFQCIIKAGNWFASRVAKGDYVLSGCTVSPGFDFEDFELANKAELTSLYPEHEKLIGELTRS